MALLGTIAWFLALPLRDVFEYPQRVSVLSNLEADAAAYDAFAHEFAATWKLSSLPSKHPPGWMVVLATVYATVGHSYPAGKLISWVALVLTVALCSWLAHRVYGKTAAATAAVLCASSPGLRAYVGTLQYEVLTAALFTLFLVLAMRVPDASSRLAMLKRAALAGSVGAALVLTRETFVLVVPLVACWVWARLRVAPDRRAGALAAITLMTVAAAPPAVWSAAQSIHYERFILISEKGPKEFQLGNNPLANGTYNEPLAGMAEPAGVAFVRAHPVDAMRLAFRKALYMFGILRDGWNVPHPAAIWLWRATTGAMPLTFIAPIVRGGWLLAACLVALFLVRRHESRVWWLLPASVGMILAAHLVTLGSYRFAIPLLPILYVIASGPVASLVRAAAAALRSRVTVTAGAALVVMAVLAQFRAWPLSVEYHAAELDGLSANNMVDPVSQSLSRVGDAKRGVRPIALLPHEYLPRGSVTLSARLRRLGSMADDTRPVGRVALLHVGEQPACVQDVSARDLRDDRFTEVSVRCPVTRDEPLTLAVFNLGEVDLSIDTIRLSWHQ